MDNGDYEQSRLEPCRRETMKSYLNCSYIFLYNFLSNKPETLPTNKPLINKASGASTEMNVLKIMLSISQYRCCPVSIKGKKLSIVYRIGLNFG